MPHHDQLVPVGRGGLEITQLGLGTAPLGGLFTSVAESEADAVIASAVLAGIRYFDTAPLYGHTRAEIRLGRGLSPYRGLPTVLSTKVGIVMTELDGTEETSLYVDAEPLAASPDYSAGAVRPALEASMARLGVDTLGMVFVHDPEEHLDQALNETVGALIALRDEGLISSIGVGTNYVGTAERFIDETDIDVMLLAGRYTILDQSALDIVLPRAVTNNVSVIAGSVFNSGVFVNPVAGSTFNYAPVTEEVLERTRRIHAVLARFEVPPAAAGLQFPLRHPAVRAILTGARNVGEVEDNVADFDRVIPDELWAELERSGLVRSV